MLHIGPHCSLNISLRIIVYLLELIDSHNARPVGHFKILEDFIQGCDAGLNLPQLHIERWLTCRRKRNARLQRMHTIPKTFQRPLAVGLKPGHNLLAKFEHKLTQRLGVIYINEKGVIITLNRRLAEIMLYEATFPHATRCNECHIVPIDNLISQLARLLLTVTKVTSALISADYKRIEQLFHTFIIL